MRPLAPASAALLVRAAPQPTLGAGGESGDLFVAKPVSGRSPAAKYRPAPELTAALALCHQLRRKRARPEKKRIAHLICMNLLAVLNRPSQQL